MLPKFLKFLLTSSGKTPYTFDWPEAANPPAVVIDLSRSSFGPIAMGGSIDDARVLGRPDEYLRYDKGCCGLAYYSRGFMFEFDGNRCLSFAAFFISPDPSENRSIQCRPVRFKGGAVLDASAGESSLRSVFGNPVDQSSDAEGRSLSFNVGGLEVDATSAVDGRLMEITIASTRKQSAR
ncbi:MAG TPA: hypothetical protein VHO24_00860 [Opitutaceae bacterium]|nr:hypothetical protein [Opitutaceae bacterium]